jgi:prepilin-type N-terminal cleavage/methylation domain-containing protein
VFTIEVNISADARKAKGYEVQMIIDRRHQRRQESGDQAGLTLIECLIVIVILGILASGVVFAVQSFSTSTARSACAGDYKTVESAVVAYKAQEGTYPRAADAGANGYASPVVMPSGDLVGVLMTRQSNGIGPWLNGFPVNSGHYQIAVTAGGAVSVYDTDGTTGTRPAPPTLVSAGCGSLT